MSAAFNSTSARLAAPAASVTTETETTGDPLTARDRLNRSRSFSRTALNGRSGFGSCSGRDLPWARPSHDDRPRAMTPGRQRRPPHAPSRPESPRPVRRPSGSFASTSERFVSQREPTPGPGSYMDKPDIQSTSSKKLRRSASFGSSRRFTEPRTHTSDSLGPATRPSAFGPPPFRGPSASFKSASKRELPMHRSDAPDPGQYQSETFRSMAADVRANSYSMSAAFADTSSRFKKPPKAEGPDMGEYDPTAQNSMASISQRGTSGASAARGANGFGSCSARRFTNDAVREDVPGPGAYGAPLKPSCKDNRACCSFASKGKRMDYVTRAETPSVGAYDPDAAFIASMAVKSHNKSSSSFGSKASRALNSTPRETMEAPGPGAYAQENYTIARSIPSGHGHMSASFASGSVGRDSFLAT